MSTPSDLSQLTPAQKRALLKERTRHKQDTIAADRYLFDAFPEILELEGRIEQLADWGVSNPTFLLHEGAPCQATTRVEGRELINFYHYNYAGLGSAPEVRTAASQAVARYGCSTGGSRLAAGELPLHRELEAEIAAFTGLEDAVVFLGGHAANESTIGHLLGKGDLVLHDALAHNSILEGALLAGCDRRAFRHLDATDADRILTTSRHKYRRVLIAIEGCYSAEGDMPDLSAFVELKQRHKALLFLDEAHSLGVLGQTGRGICEECSVDPAGIDILMGTLSKAFAAAGGFIAGSGRLVRYLRYTTPGFVYSVGISPPVAAAALAAFQTLRAQPERMAKLHRLAKLFRDEATAAGLDIGRDVRGAVIPVYIDPPERCLRLVERLRQRGVGANPMIPPAVAPGTSRIRFFVTAAHQEQQIRQGVATVAEELARLKETI
ncbi:MAG: aminotransferase class I/II-fold pyridoxal phosphate-dependent enzyme [Candidatus Latescibacteria bacterium]|nr:aminotransferase class I/II-fold pyridoxal phosphate-dependent enzyme [Candidatus Latescibacterota bacterium]